MRFDIRRARRGVLRRSQWYVRLVFDNGEVFAHSESYNNHADAVAAVERVRREAGAAGISG